MKLIVRIFTIILLAIFIRKLAVGQSPFNYGHNKKIYFISTELRNKLGLETIYCIDQLQEGDFGGMHENWDVTAIEFDSNMISCDWAPISLDSGYKFNFDNITTNLDFLNGSGYEFSNGKLNAYGGGGYGTFDWKEIFRYANTMSIITTACVGHCGSNTPLNYSKNIINRKGRLLYTVSYPTPEESEGTFFDTGSTNELEIFLNSKVTTENLPDTCQYHYNRKGLLLNVNKYSAINNRKEAKTLFSYGGDYPKNYFHQLYIGKVEMENFFSKTLKCMPELVLIEIYEQGVFSFSLNAQDGKYYQSACIVLEK